MTALLPCPNPWCISTSAPLPVATKRDGWRVWCACGVATPRFPTSSEAITAWNRRAAPASPRSLGVSQDEPQPSDWVLVPREPTEAMIEAYFRRSEELGFTAGITATAAWAAMLSASPPPPAEPPVEGWRGTEDRSSNASRAAQGTKSLAATSAEPSGPEVPEEDGVGYEPGSVLWHCSEEDGGPDVGIQVGLGLGMSLYCGEMPTRILEEHGIDLSIFPDGWWLVLYGPEDQWIIGTVPENYRAQEAVEHIGWAIAEAAKRVPPLSAKDTSERNGLAPKAD